MIKDVAAGWSGLRAPCNEGASPSSMAAAMPKVCGIVLAGVHAWGDCILEQVVCRPLLPIAARPLIWHTLDWLYAGGVPGAVLCANSDTAALRRTLGTDAELGIALDYFEDVMPRGPAGCVRDAALGADADLFLVTEGTIVPSIDLTALLRAHLESDAAVTVVVSGSGVGEDHRRGGQEPLGVYVFSRSVLERIPATGYQDIKETLIPSLHRAGERIVTYVPHEGLAPRVTDAASYLQVNMYSLERMFAEGSAPPGYVRIGDAWVAPSAQVDPLARFVGPVLVGPRSTIGRGALIVGPTTIGADCSIGPRAVVSRAAVWNHCRIGFGAIVDQCVLTDGGQVDEELVVRETVCVPKRRNDRKLLDRAALCSRLVTRAHPPYRSPGA